MEREGFLRRFIFLVLLFVGSIGFLIFIPHIFALLLGWDGLGLVSFLLVTFYCSPKALGAGIFTALRNRVGDALIIVSISLLVEWHGHYELISFRGQPVAGILLIVAAMTKSAQFPFSSWLPAAIEAPTPVSALVHSSTLVTAGVYLMIRFYPLLSQGAGYIPTMLLIGAVTRLFAGIGAVVERDLKKVIALSTLSQLGLIVIRLGLGLPVLAFFHLLIHAMFKALLFICAGVFIHLHHHAQDIRYLGERIGDLPQVTRAVIISRGSLCAIPLTSGLYSKDAIVEIMLWAPRGIVAILIVLSSVFATRVYSGRFFFLAALSPRKVLPVTRLVEPFSLPLYRLRIGAIVAGLIVVRLIGPFNFEPFNPVYKHFIIALMVLGLFGVTVIIYCDPLRVSKGHLSLARVVSARSMIFLTPITTQELLSGLTQVRKRLRIRDQSWVEIGQRSFWGYKVSSRVPVFFVTGVCLLVIFFIFI